jgi:hypothetical protein
MTDTERSYVPLFFVMLIGFLRLVGPITRNDAPASVRRGYTAAEVRELSQRIDGAAAKVRTYFPYRFGILLWKRPLT